MRHIAELQRVNGASAVQHRQSSSSVCTTKLELSLVLTSPGWWRSLLTRLWRRRRSAKRCQPLWRWANGASARRLSPVSVCSLAAGLHRPQTVGCDPRIVLLSLCVFRNRAYLFHLENCSVLVQMHWEPHCAWCRPQRDRPSSPQLFCRGQTLRGIIRRFN